MHFQRYDAESHSYMLNERVFDPATGLFLSADPISDFGGAATLGGPYVYGNGDPYSFSDPDGQFAWFVPIIIGAIIGGTVAAANHGSVEDILRGTGLGALAGAFYWAGAAYIGGALGAAAAGAANAATDTALFGQPSDLIAATLEGAAIGAVGYYAIGQQVSVFGNGNGFTGTADYLVNSAVRGAVVGAAYSLVTGKNIGDAIANGAIAWTVAAALSSGVVATGTAPKWGNGAWVYRGAGAWPITFGNVITGDPTRLAEPAYYDGRKTTPGASGRPATIEQHELAHIPQYMTLGPAMAPPFFAAILSSYAVAGTLGWLSRSGFMNGTHQYSIFENDSGFTTVPNY
jgi:RHS repeat-associated protein